MNECNEGMNGNRVYQYKLALEVDGCMSLARIDLHLALADLQNNIFNESE